MILLNVCIQGNGGDKTALTIVGTLGIQTTALVFA